MSARFLALALGLAWPSFAHAGWFADTIGHPIVAGLGLGVHEFKGAMATGARQTRAAFGDAARGVGIDGSQPHPEAGATCQTSPCPDARPPLPAGAGQTAPNAQPIPAPSPAPR